MSTKRKRQPPDFKLLSSCRARFGRYLIVKAFKSDNINCKTYFLGIIASKKISNKANIRNKVKRRLKSIGYELSRQNINTFNKFHWLFIAKKNIMLADYHELLTDCRKITKNYANRYKNSN